MKPLVLALLLFVPISAAAQESRLIREYDRFEDRTRYWTTPTYLSSGLKFAATFSFKGKGAGHQIEGFSLVFSSTSRDWQYLKDSRLYLLIDGVSVGLGSAKARDGDVEVGDRSVQVKEDLEFSVALQTLETISKAKSVEMRLGKSEFKLRSYVLSDIGELLAKVQVVKKK